MSASIIKNRSQLSATRSRSAALDIIETGIRSALPENAIETSVSYDSSSQTISIKESRFGLSGRRIFVIGGGKASSRMSQSLERIIGPQRITAGIVTTKYGDPDPATEKIEVVGAGHPVPDRNGSAAVRRMLNLKPAYSIGQDDIVMCLLSGGGSALLPCPVDEISLDEKQLVTEILLSSGADISEVNCIRKHLSKTKGGRLGSFFAPATVVSLILSDVIGNDLSVIASAPTYPDASTFADAIRVLEKYDIQASVPARVRSYLEQGQLGKVPETAKSLVNCWNFVIGDLSLALSAMKRKALELGLSPVVVTNRQTGETGKAVRSMAKKILSGKYSGSNALLVGGETTPVVPADHGKGGRNQHYAAVSLVEMKDYRWPWTMASIGTDGSDFLPDVAGAIVDESTLPRLAAKGANPQEYIQRYDSYGLLVQTGDCLVQTGNTGTNVGDVTVYILSATSP